MDDNQLNAMLIGTLPLLLVTLGIGLWRHKFPSLRFVAASLTTAAVGISVGLASATALFYFLREISPGFPGIGGAFIIWGCYVIMSAVMGCVVGFSFPTNPPKTS